MHENCLFMGLHLTVHVCLRLCMCAAASACVITCLAVIPQIAEDALAKAWPCHSCSLP